MAKTIMVMHKNGDTRLSIKTLLEKNGYKVIEVLSFKDFLSKVNKNIDLVLINGLMPRSKIVEISRKNGLRVAYFLSSDISEDELQLYKNVIGYIDEPHDIEKFLKKIKVLIR
jgi:DNA-binding response OmpR family regulator